MVGSYWVCQMVPASPSSTLAAGPSAGPESMFCESAVAVMPDVGTIARVATARLESESTVFVAQSLKYVAEGWIAAVVPAEPAGVVMIHVVVAVAPGLTVPTRFPP